MADDKQEELGPQSVSEGPDSARTAETMTSDFPELSDLPEIARLLGDDSAVDLAPDLSPDIAKLLQGASSRRPTGQKESAAKDDEFIEVPADMLEHVAEVLGRSAAPARSTSETNPVSLEAPAPSEPKAAGTDPSGGVKSARPEPSLSTSSSEQPTSSIDAISVGAQNPSSSLAPPTRSELWTMPIDSPRSSVPAASQANIPVSIAIPPPQASRPPATERLYHGQRQGDPIMLVAEAIRVRVSGALHIRGAQGSERIIILRDGDVVTASSNAAEETLVQFLVLRGDITAALIAALPEDKLPRLGRRAAAALIARGFLGPDDLWPALRAHAEWLISRALGDGPATCQLNPHLPDELRDEPNVFGGAAGIEVFVEAVRRTLEPSAALKRLGPPNRKVRTGPFLSMLTEAALPSEEVGLIRAAAGHPLSAWLGSRSEERAAIAYAVTALHILQLEGDLMEDVASVEDGEDDDSPPQDTALPVAQHELDRQHSASIRQRVRSRRELVEDGDYFSVLGVSVDATSYEIRRAFVDGRRLFDPHRLLNAATADLADDVDLIVELLEEAYAVLREPSQRSRYREAIQASHERLAGHRSHSK